MTPEASRVVVMRGPPREFCTLCQPRIYHCYFPMSCARGETVPAAARTLWSRFQRELDNVASCRRRQELEAAMADIRAFQAAYVGREEPVAEPGLQTASPVS